MRTANGHFAPNGVIHIIIISRPIPARKYQHFIGLRGQNRAQGGVHVGYFLHRGRSRRAAVDLIAAARFAGAVHGVEAEQIAFDAVCFAIGFIANDRDQSVFVGNKAAHPFAVRACILGAAIDAARLGPCEMNIGGI